LRHTFVSMMDRAGVSPKAAQDLARHSDPSLTLGRYTHTSLQTLGEAVNRLDLPGNEAGRLPTREELATALLLSTTLNLVLLRIPDPASPLFGGTQGAPLVAPRVAPAADIRGDAPVQQGTETKEGEAA